MNNTVELWIFKLIYFTSVVFPLNGINFEYGKYIENPKNNIFNTDEKTTLQLTREYRGFFFLFVCFQTPPNNEIIILFLLLRGDFEQSNMTRSGRKSQTPKRKLHFVIRVSRKSRNVRLYCQNLKCQYANQFIISIYFVWSIQRQSFKRHSG